MPVFSEEDVYKPVSKIGGGIHGKLHIERLSFRNEEEIYRVYHGDGYCFDIIKSYDDDENEWIYSFFQEYEGFNKGLTLRKAFELLQTIPAGRGTQTP